VTSKLGAERESDGSIFFLIALCAPPKDRDGREKPAGSLAAFLGGSTMPV